MREISVVLTEPEAAALEELARRAGISVEEAAAKAVRFVLKEAMGWARSCARKTPTEVRSDGAWQCRPEKAPELALY